MDPWTPESVNKIRAAEAGLLSSLAKAPHTGLAPLDSMVEVARKQASLVLVLLDEIERLTKTNAAAERRARNIDALVRTTGSP